MHYLAEKLRLIHERDSYIKQYIDNFNFLLKGLVLGVLGGMLGSSIDRQLAQLGVLYTASLAVALVLIFYFVLNSVSKKASGLQKKKSYRT